MRRGEPALLLLNVGYFSRGAVAVSGLHGAPALCPLSGGLRPSPGDPCRRALRSEETFPQPRRTGSVLDAGPSRTAGRVSDASLQFPFSIRAATSSQNAKRFFDRARFALRCSVSATFQAFASPY
jgi:hypothetical protein